MSPGHLQADQFLDICRKNEFSYWYDEWNKIKSRIDAEQHLIRILVKHHEVKT